MKVRYLLDENLSPRLISAVRRLNEQVDLLRVGEAGAPGLGTDDPTILRYLASHQRLLVTANRSTIPNHLMEYYRTSDEPHWGILWIRPATTIGELANALHFIWAASDAEEWQNRTDWIPF